MFEDISLILTGSLGGIVLKSIFDLYTANRAFKRDLKKKLFEKKLDAAEKASASMYIFETSLFNIALAFDLMADKKQDIHTGVIKDFVQQISTINEKMSTIHRDLAALSLYADLSDELNSTYDEDRAFMEDVSDLRFTFDRIDAEFQLYEQAQQAKALIQEEKSWQKILSIEVEYKQKMSSISIKMERKKVAMKDLRLQIRNLF